MARFDIYRLNDEVPFVVDVQADMLAHLASVVVVPLVPASQFTVAPLTRLNPSLTIDGVDYTLVTTDIAAIPRSLLGARAANAASQRDAIVTAIDFLLQGF